MIDGATLTAGKELDERIGGLLGYWREESDLGWDIWYTKDPNAETCHSYAKDSLPIMIIYSSDCWRDGLAMFTTSNTAAVALFMLCCDPNRTSIHPCGNGPDGLWWAIYYDEEQVASGPTFPLAVCAYYLWTKEEVA